MTQHIECDDCGNKKFHGPERDYYAYQYRFECAECGSVVVVNESEEE